MSVGLQPPKLTHLTASCCSCSGCVALSPVCVCVCVCMCVCMHTVKSPQQRCSHVFTPSPETVHRGCNQSCRVPHNNSIPSLWLQRITLTSRVCDYSFFLMSMHTAVMHMDADKGMCLHIEFLHLEVISVKWIFYFFFLF